MKTTTILNAVTVAATAGADNYTATAITASLFTLELSATTTAAGGELIIDFITGSGSTSDAAAFAARQADATANYGIDADPENPKTLRIPLGAARTYMVQSPFVGAKGVYLLTRVRKPVALGAAATVTLKVTEH